MKNHAKDEKLLTQSNLLIQKHFRLCSKNQPPENFPKELRVYSSSAVRALAVAKSLLELAFVDVSVFVLYAVETGAEHLRLLSARRSASVHPSISLSGLSRSGFCRHTEDFFFAGIFLSSREVIYALAPSPRIFSLREKQFENPDSVQQF